MRILHVVTWVAPGNPFGGPLRVATNDADELRRRGHHVEVIAAQPMRRARARWRSQDQGVDGFDAVRIVPGAGFSGLISFGLLRHVWRAVRTFDVVHLHLARDLVTLPAAAITRRRGVAFVVQCHGMIDPSPRIMAKVLDRLLTRRVLGSAESVLVLTQQERSDVEAAFPTLPMRFEELPNGVPAVPRTAAGCHDSTRQPEVLFCSRLHVRKRPALFAEMASALLDDGVRARFSMIGSDEGELDAVIATLARSIHGNEIAVEGFLEPSAVGGRLAACDVLVLPSVNEPFPMIILEALAAGRPVVVTDTCGLAGFVTENRCGVVVPGDNIEELTAAVRRLVEHGDERCAMGAAGRAAVDEQLGMRAIGERLEQHYSGAIERTARRRAS